MKIYLIEEIDYKFGGGSSIIKAFTDFEEAKTFRDDYAEKAYNEGEDLDYYMKIVDLVVNKKDIQGLIKECEEKRRNK